MASLRVRLCVCVRVARLCSSLFVCAFACARFVHTPILSVTGPHFCHAALRLLPSMGWGGKGKGGKGGWWDDSRWSWDGAADFSRWEAEDASRAQSSIGSRERVRLSLLRKQYDATVIFNTLPQLSLPPPPPPAPLLPAIKADGWSPSA